MLKPLPIDLEDLCIALETAPGSEMRWYLDVQTGATLLVNDEYDPADIDGPDRDEIEAKPERYLLIPEADPDHGRQDMQDFIATLGDFQLKQTLELALSAAGPSRRFKAVLGHLPEHKEGWFAFKRQRTLRRAELWLAGHGLRAGPA